MTSEAQRWQALKGWGVEFGITVGTVHALGWPVFVVAMVRLIVSGR